MAEQLHSENQGIRLVEAGAVYPVESNARGEQFFATEKKHPPETQDLFHSVWLAGVRPGKQDRLWYQEPAQLERLHGITVVDNAVVVDSLGTMINTHEDLFPIAVEAEPGFVGQGKLLRCDMHIDGLEVYYTAIMETTDPGTEDSHAMTAGNLWRSSDPNDPNGYELMASPSNTALLNRLSFSFHVMPADGNDMVIR